LQVTFFFFFFYKVKFLSSLVAPYGVIRNWTVPYRTGQKWSETLKRTGKVPKPIRLAGFAGFSLVLITLVSSAGCAC
jgi:hypothetical protein